MAREYEMINIANKKDIFTMAYVFTPEEATEMAKAGVDCLVPHAGGTKCEMTGFQTVPHEAGIKVVQDMISAAKANKPECSMGSCPWRSFCKTLRY
jgi:predicted TIM-barrel enzyme